VVAADVGCVIAAVDAAETTTVGLIIFETA